MEEKKILTDEELDNVVGGAHVYDKKIWYEGDCRDVTWKWYGMPLTRAENGAALDSFESTDQPVNYQKVKKIV